MGMATMIHSQAHQGYLDGIEGNDPTSTSTEYELGWSAGYEDREKGLKLRPYCGPVENLPVKRGDTVTIRRITLVHRSNGKTVEAKRNYKVTLHDVDQGRPAYVDYGHFVKPALIRPTIARVTWVGAGGYWSDCDLSEISIEETSK